MLDTGVRIGEALGLRHEDMGVAEWTIAITPRPNDNRAHAKAGEDAKIEVVVPAEGRRARLSVDKLGAVDEPASLTWLRKTTAAMLPQIDLPDLLFEVHSWTGFLDAFTHVSESASRMAGLPVSVVALLVAKVCNIGLTPVINPNHVELTRTRLSHVDQNYLRWDTIAAANALLIEAQSRISLARCWGDGHLASVDGVRFVVPARTINAAPSPKYYGFKRGVTWLNAVNDQVSGIGRWWCRAPRACGT